jgi:hypothetical protein
LIWPGSVWFCLESLWLLLLFSSQGNRVAGDVNGGLKLEEAWAGFQARFFPDPRVVILVIQSQCLRSSSLIIYTPSYAASIIMLPLIARLISPPSQTLRTLKPTPSTVSFTVSTRPERKTVPAVLKHWVGVLIRILVGAGVLLLLWVKWRVSSVQSTDVLLRVFGGPQTVLMLQFVGRCQWRFLVPGTLAVLFTVLRRGYTGSPALIFSFTGPH